MTNPFRYLEPYAKRPEQRFHMAGVGLREWMQPCIVNRPTGTWDWLLMFFYTPVTIEVHGERTACPANTLMVWDEHDSHFYGNPEVRWESSWIHCQGSLLPGLMREAGLRTGAYPDLDLTLLLEKYLPLMYEERVRRNMDLLILEALFICLLREIGRVHRPREHTLPRRIHSLKQFIETRYPEPLRLDDLCQHAAMSKPHLISEFRKHVGMPPIDYLIHVRLEHARSLLLDRNLSVGEIAERVGYPNIYHFSKMFKKHMGRSPSAFRA